MANLTEYQKKQNIIFLCILLFSSFLFALSYKLFFSTLKVFILLGSLSVLTNLIVCFYYCLEYRNNLAEEYKKNINLIVSILTLIIPFSIFYILFALLIFGFNVPFNVPFGDG